jgi:hypothetical protein
VRQIRDNIFEVTFSELGSPKKKGDIKLDGLGTVIIDVADLNYVTTMRELGYEPKFFISRSEKLGGRYVVVARQEKA